MNKAIRLAIVTASSTAALGMAVGGSFLLLADRFVRQLTRPHEIIPDDAPTWAGWKFPDSEPPPPLALQRAIVFHAADGARIQGEFWAQPAPAPTIIISHGFRLPRAKFRSVAALEYSYGCNILLFDYRGHGESAAIPTTGGNAEVRDLLAAIKIAASQPETLPGSIFIHGFSMGAAVALLLPPQPEVAGIIADSPYARLDEMLRRIITWQLHTNSVAWPRGLRPLKKLFPMTSAGVITGARLLFHLRFHHALSARPEARLRAGLRGTTGAHPPLLLMHARGDPLIPFAHAERIAVAARVAGIPVETYFVDSAVHCGAYGADPALYCAHLKAFVERNHPDLSARKTGPRREPVDYRA